MTSLTITDMIAGVDVRLTTLPGRLIEAGIDVPGALSDGLAKARWRYQLPDIDAAKKAIAESKTEKDYRAACVALSDVVAQRAVMQSPAFTGATDAYRLASARHGFDQASDSLISTIIDRYNDEIPGFRDTLADLPNLKGITSVYDLPASAGAALHAAKNRADVMSRYLSLYLDVGSLCGHECGGWTTKDLGGATSLLSAIATYDSGQALESAARDLTRYHNGEGNHAVLQPHAVAAWSAIDFRMVHPVEAEERREEALSDYYGGQAPPMAFPGTL